jgi:putative membrane protein
MIRLLYLLFIFEKYTCKGLTGKNTIPCMLTWLQIHFYVPFCNLFLFLNSIMVRTLIHLNHNKMKSRASFVFTIILFGSILMLSISSHAQKSPQLSDPEVASAAVTANQVDIDYAAIALKTSKNKDILNFANTMTTDHKAVIAQAVTLAKKLKVTPQTNYLTKKLQTDANATKAKLKKLKGAAFDKAYIDNEVAYHKAVIGAVETLLIPDTDNAELKSLLQNVVPALKTHLAHAEMLQKSIK